MGGSFSKVSFALSAMSPPNEAPSVREALQVCKRVHAAPQQRRIILMESRQQSSDSIGTVAMRAAGRRGAGTWRGAVFEASGAAQGGPEYWPDRLPGWSNSDVWASPAATYAGGAGSVAGSGG